MAEDKLDKELEELSDSNVQEDEGIEKGTGLSEEDVMLLLKQKKVEHLQLENELFRQTIENEKQNRGQRKDFAMKIFDFMSLYMFVVFFFLLLDGVTCWNFNLSENILLTLLGTTTANVIGVFTFVAKYLFPTKNKM